MAKALTPIAAQAIKPGHGRREVPDGGCRGLHLVVQPSGAKSFALRYRLHGRPAKLTLGPALFLEKGAVEPGRPSVGSPMTLAAARKLAAQAMHEVGQGRDPALAKKVARRTAAAAAADTVEAVCTEFLAREGKSLRSAKWRESILRRLVYPELGARPITSIRRKEIIRLLDSIEDRNGPVMCDRTLAVLRRVFNWHAIRDDDFVSPIIRGMARTSSKSRARVRTLSDDEIQLVWKAAETAGPFGRLVQFLLLTAARRNEAADMTRDEISGGDWTLPGSRNKTKVDLVRPLSGAAQAVLATLPKIGGHYFTSDGKGPLRGFGKFKSKLDARILQSLRATDGKSKPLPRWTLHDLRRTARSLLSRAGVDADHAERCLGHMIAGVRGIYDRHAYYDEKKAAYEALAVQVDLILNPRSNVVTSLRRRPRKGQ